MAKEQFHLERRARVISVGSIKVIVKRQCGCSHDRDKGIAHMTVEEMGGCIKDWHVTGR